MDSSSGASSGSSLLQSSGSEEDLKQLMDERKRKRMISNRESARRSRLRKQRHLDDLMTQLAHLRQGNNQILNSMNVTTQQFLNIEAENSILRAQMVELSQRLESLNEILSFLNANNHDNGGIGVGGLAMEEPYGLNNFAQNESMVDGFYAMNNNSSWNFLCSNQPIMVTADILQC